MTTWRDGVWSPPLPLTADDPEGEIGSGHVAHTDDDGLVYVWIGKKMTPEHHFRSFWRWREDGVWSEPEPFTDGSADAWHSNVERRPDGSYWSDGMSGLAAAKRRCSLRTVGTVGSAPGNLSAGAGRPGERAHFAFGADGTDHVTWFHKQAGSPRHIYVRSGRPGAWSNGG